MALPVLILQDCLAAPARVHNQNIMWKYPLFAKKKWNKTMFTGVYRLCSNHTEKCSIIIKLEFERNFQVFMNIWLHALCTKIDY